MLSARKLPIYHFLHYGYWPIHHFLHQQYWSNNYWIYWPNIENIGARNRFLRACYWLLSIQASFRRQVQSSVAAVLNPFLLQLLFPVAYDGFKDTSSSIKRISSFTWSSNFWAEKHSTIIEQRERWLQMTLSVGQRWLAYLALDVDMRVENKWSERKACQWYTMQLMVQKWLARRTIEADMYMEQYLAVRRACQCIQRDSLYQNSCHAAQHFEHQLRATVKQWNCRFSADYGCVSYVLKP